MIWFGVALGVIMVLAILGAAIVVGPLFPMWIQGRASSVPVTIFQMIGMKLRGVNPQFVVEQAILLYKAGIEIPLEALEAHMLSGGRLMAVADALISADKAGLGIDFYRLAAIDLAGRDVVDAVKASVNPKVLVCPPSHSPAIAGVAKDGIRVSARVRVTVRTDLDKLIGGANQDTIVARVGEGIVAAVGTAPSHKDIIQQPELISQYILNRGLDRGTSFEIVSVDVSDVTIHDNVGAALAEQQAQADKQVAQARAEMRRVMAVAREREMKARVVDMTAQVTAARATLPLAVANTARQGRMWINTRPVGDSRNRLLWHAGT